MSPASSLFRRRPAPPAERTSGRRVLPNVEVLETREVPAAAALDTYVASLYQGFLGRTADPGGLASWVSNLRAGASRPQVAANLLASTEFHAREVQILFQTFLGRTADQAALNWWGTILERGGVYEQAKAGVLGSAEFYARAGGTNFNFLNELYVQALNRPLDEGGRVFWGTALAGGAPREQVAFQILVSQEAQQVKVANTYEVILGRPLDLAGSTFWVNALVDGARNEDLFAGVVGSDEFFNQLTTALGQSGLDDPNAAADLFLTNAGKFDVTLAGTELLNRNISTNPTAVIQQPAGSKPTAVVQVVKTVPIVAPFFISPFLFFPPPPFLFFDPLINPFFDPFFDPGLSPLFFDPLFFDPLFFDPLAFDPQFFDPGFFDPGFFDPGVVDPGFFNPGFVDPGFVDPGFFNPSFFDPGFVDPGFFDPGFFDPGFGGFDFGGFGFF